VYVLAAVLFSVWCSASVRAGQSDEALAWAGENIAAGKYPEAIDLLKKALAAQPEGTPERRKTVLALIEPLRITGNSAEARELCAGLLKADAKDTVAALLKAEIDFEVGNYKEAREAYDKIIAEQPDNERAWALRTFVCGVQNDRETLKKTADHFFDLQQKKKDYFTGDQVKDPTELAYIALGFQHDNPKSAFEEGYLFAEDLAKERKLKLPEIFLWSARLAHELYHFAFAQARYAQVLAMRPRHPDALAGQASIVWQTRHDLETVEKMLKEALAVNPRHIDSLLLYAAVDLEEDRYDEAKKHIDAALQVNPNHLEALAMLAFYYVDMAQPEKEAEVEKRVLAINPKCSDFYYNIGQMMENKRGFNTAPAYYEKAIAADPEDWRGYYGLGMNTSRQGAQGEEKGKELLLKAFAKNRFNVWASNMVKVLDKFVGDKPQEVPPVYMESRTEHFILKFHNKEAAIVRPYIEEWAEAAYASQTKKFNFVPEGPLTIELCFSLQDQAARTVGLPNLGALGVCFGKLCTVVSPREGKGGTEAFNWRKVLEHEFGHVMVLQLSKFRVPRWYTEAFSTYLEDDSRIKSDQMMKDAIAKGRIKDIDKMNEYFRANMLMAYVHGRYVIEYIDKTCGFDAHIKATKLFAEGKKLTEALQEATGKTLKELNDGQLAFVNKAFEDVRLRPTYDPPTVVALEMAARSADAPAQAVADFALAQYALRKSAAAEALAKRALDKDPKCTDAINVLGAIAYDRKDYEAAKQRFISSTEVDPNRSFEAWRRLAVIYKKEGRTTKAIQAFETARAKYPRYIGPENPHYELPDLYEDLEPAQSDKALGVWRDAAKINTTDAEAAMNGLKLAMKLKNYQAATEFVEAHNEIDPYNGEVHRMGGKAYEELKQYKLAARELAVATALDDKDVAGWVALARVYKAAGDPVAARKAVESALEVDGTHAEAKKLKEELKE
jgi:tetratricopeptide (TPR) repeat protein